MKPEHVKNAWLPYTILRAASFLAPRDERSEWLEGWRSELWYIPRRGATLFCLGAFQDALWLRQNNPRPVKKTGIYMQSPFSCLAVLATLAAVSFLIAIRLERTLTFPEAPRTSASGGLAEFLLIYLLLAAIALIIGDSPGHHRSMPRPGKWRSWIFLILKIMLVLPILQCTLVLIVVVNVPFLSLGFFAIYILLVRWAFTDQRRRCPVCLRLLTDPVRIGTPSQTFLAWYGAESICARGHGLLHAPETSASYSGNQQWLRLDDSWRELFSKGAELRP